ALAGGPHGGAAKAPLLLSESSERAGTAWLAAQKEAMVAELREMVNTDGGSYDKAGVDRTGAQVKRFLNAHGIEVETIAGERHGDCLRGLVPGG
ncbi:MAG: hypothetical protein C4289_05720, partial [Chloroflexota bacterium]